MRLRVQDVGLHDSQLAEVRRLLTADFADCEAADRANAQPQWIDSNRMRPRLGPTLSDGAL
jgi:hypothetical protein